MSSLKQRQMRKNRPASVIISLVIGLMLLLVGITQAAPIYQPPGSNLTYGDVTHGQRVLSAVTNPAAAAAEIHRSEDKARTGTMFSLGAGLEYGNVDDLFDLIDELSANIKPSEPGPGDPDLPPAPGQLPQGKPTFGDIIDVIQDIDDPDLQDTIDKVKDRAVFLGGTLAVLIVEGYGKLHAGGDLPIVVGKEFLGGAWTFNLNVTGTSKAFGVIEPIEFDADVALAELEAAYDLTPDDPPTTFDLTGGVELTIDPATGDVSLYFNNDTLLVTRAAVISEFALGYGRQFARWGDGKLYWGAKAKYFYTRLSRLDTRFGDLTDADELFDTIRNGDFRNEGGFSADLGLLWVSPNYSLGATLTNINEPSFRYPAADTSRFTAQKVVDFLEKDQEYVIERQLKLEGSWFTPNRRWAVNAAYDVDAVRDPMQDHYQWATISAGYATGNWWIPGVRVGYRKNLEGSNLGYIGAGVTLFKVLNFDIASTTESTEISGTDLPRGLIFNLGVEISF
jgi:hypothetical protein